MRICAPIKKLIRIKLINALKNLFQMRLQQRNNIIVRSGDIYCFLNTQLLELAIVCKILNEVNAHIIKGFLENENIPCQLENVSFHAGAAPVADLMKVRLWSKKKMWSAPEYFLQN